MLFNEPKLLKLVVLAERDRRHVRFSALQRAEIAEIRRITFALLGCERFSALQRAEIAEISRRYDHQRPRPSGVSVLFNEPKLLK